MPHKDLFSFYMDYYYYYYYFEMLEMGLYDGEEEDENEFSLIC
jgi:hypothetical protein